MIIKYIGNNVYCGNLLGTNKTIPALVTGSTREEVIRRLVKWL